MTMKFCNPVDIPSPDDTPDEARARKLLGQLGWCGHYMHFHGGGRSGQTPILCLLAKCGGQMSQQELGLHFDLKPGSLSEILSKLEAGGLIERTRNPEDRRQLLIRLTEEGSRRAAQDQVSRCRFRANAFKNLSVDEQLQLIDLLARVRENWEAYCE